MHMCRSNAMVSLQEQASGLFVVLLVIEGKVLNRHRDLRELFSEGTFGWKQS